MVQMEPWLTGPAAHLCEALEWEALLGLIEPRSGERLLEVGCGRGLRLARFLSRGLDVMGLEAEPALIDEARHRLSRHRLVRSGEPEALPFEDNAFDLVLLSPLVVRCADPAAALAEAGRVAKRRVIVEVVNQFSWLGLRQRLTPDQANPRFGPWSLKRLIAAVFGPCPVIITSLFIFPQSWLMSFRRLETSPLTRRLLLGGLLFAGVEITYTLRADPLPASAGPVPADTAGTGMARSRLHFWPRREGR